MNTDPGSPMSIDFLKAGCVNKENGLLKVRMRMALPHIYLYTRPRFSPGAEVVMRAEVAEKARL